MPGSGVVPLAYCVLGHGLKSLLCGVIGYKGAGVKERVTMWVKVGGGELFSAMHSHAVSVQGNRGSWETEQQWLELALAEQSIYRWQGPSTDESSICLP